jgi:hypothetical protein
MSFGRALAFIGAWVSIGISLGTLAGVCIAGVFRYSGTVVLCLIPLIFAGLLGGAYLYWLENNKP